MIGEPYDVGMHLDLNADVAEGSPEDTALLPLLTSVNVALGAHAGDAETLRDTVQRARELGLAVGAHPGYPDRAGFGRRELGLSAAEIGATLRGQLARMRGALDEIGGGLSHLKPHGALYWRVHRDPAAGAALCRAMRDWPGARLFVLAGPAGEALARQAREHGVPVAREAFAERGYAASGELLERGQPGAELDEAAAAAQALAVARGELRAGGGAGVPLALRADTVCIHGDRPGAARLALAVRAVLEGAGVRLCSLNA